MAAWGRLQSPKHHVLPDIGTEAWPNVLKFVWKLKDFPPAAIADNIHDPGLA